MAKYTHSILEVDGLIAADGQEIIDLPVGPLTSILIEIAPLNDTGTLTNYSFVEGLLASLENVRLTHRGSAIIDASGPDLAALAILYRRQTLWQSNAILTNNDRRSLILPLTFSRRAFDPLECLPKSNKGELQLSLTWDIADTGYDGLRRSIEVIELPDANPTHFEKTTTLAQTFGATGQNEQDLPVGNLIRAILGFSSTEFEGAVPDVSLEQFELLVNNVQSHLSQCRFTVNRGIMGLLGIPYPPDFRHIHHDGGATVAGSTGEPQPSTSLDDNYVLMNLDPTRDDMYSLATEGARRVHLRVDADGADAVRFLPVELVPATRF